MIRVLDIRRLKPSSVQSLSHQLIQTCSVSGTAKGKGKTAAPLKRSKVTTKKGKSSEDASEKGEGGRRYNQSEEMVDSCLVATSPVRHLKPKEREREAERERMGLISKARAKEIETFKKTKSEKPDPGLFMGPPGFDPISLGLVDKDKLITYELTVEDGRRLAKEYSRFLMRRHRARQAAESNLLRLKKEAIEALPEGLREAALVLDLAPFPVNRFMATLTPPIEGYIEKVNEAARKSAGKEKLR